MFKKFRLVIFLVLISCLIISTFFPQELAQRYFYQAIWFKILWAILAMGLFIDLVNLLKKKSFTFAVIYSGLLFILLGGLLTSFLEEEGFMELKEGQTQNEFWVNDNLAKPLDFSIYLKDFSVEFYPVRNIKETKKESKISNGVYPEEKKALRFVKSYKSRVTINQKGRSLKEAIIAVNSPLKFRGYSFYQYGYDPDIPKQTILQVVKDPGLPFVYSGYLILLLGILASFKKIWKI